MRVRISVLRWDDACFGIPVGAENADLCFDERDWAPFVPKCVVVDPISVAVKQTRRHEVPWNQTIIYELHVRGYTKLNPKVPEKAARTFAGLSNSAVIRTSKHWA